jgi:hypothetical protein
MAAAPAYGCQYCELVIYGAAIGMAFFGSSCPGGSIRMPQSLSEGLWACSREFYPAQQARQNSREELFLALVNCRGQTGAVDQAEGGNESRPICLRYSLSGI